MANIRSALKALLCYVFAQCPDAQARREMTHLERRIANLEAGVAAEKRWRPRDVFRP